MENYINDKNNEFINTLGDIINLEKGLKGHDSGLEASIV